MALFPVIFEISEFHPENRLHLETLSRLARIAAQESAKKMGVSLSRFEKTPDGQPMTEGGVSWSLSHKRSRVIGVASLEIIGIDCEEIKERGPLLEKAVVVPQEAALFRQRNLTVVELFSAKEAVLKAHGQGIKDLWHCLLVAVTPQWLQFDFLGKKLWVLQTHRENHVFSLATPTQQPVTWIQHLAPSP